MDDAQIGEGVADFLALVEARPADHAIGQAQRDEAILELAHLERGAHQDGDLVERMRIARPVVALQLLDLLADRARLFLRIPARGDLHLVARHVLGAQRLAEAALVVGDQVRGGGEDMGGGAVVALEADDLGAGKVVLEAQDVVHLGAAPAVDRLVVVADAADVLERARRRLLGGCGRLGLLALRGLGVLSLPACGERGEISARGISTAARALAQQPQPEILRHVGVLILVHQNVSEPPLILAQHLGLLAEQPDAFEQQVAEVGGVEHFQPLLEGGVELFALAAGEARGLAGGNLVGRKAAVLPAVDEAGEHARRPALLVDVLGCEQLLEQTDLIVGIEDGEVRLQADQLGMPPQNFHADRMKGAKPRHSLDNLAHHGPTRAFISRAALLVKVTARISVRPCTSGGKNVRYPRCQDTGFSGPGAGQNQHRAVQGHDRLALLRIEVLEIGRARGRSRARGDPAGLRHGGNVS